MLVCWVSEKLELVHKGISEHATFSWQKFAPSSRNLGPANVLRQILADRNMSRGIYS